MPYSLAVRINLPFSDASGIIHQWALKCDKLLAYQHVGSVTEKVHIHLLMIRVACDKERLKQIANQVHKSLGSGNEFWSFKSKTKKGGDVSDESAPKYITYMSKGSIDPSYNKGYDDTFLQACKEQWEDAPDVKSQEQIKYSDFEDEVWELYKNDVRYFVQGSTMWVKPEYINKIKSLARSWAFAKYKSIWSVRTATDAKMVFLTYLMRGNFDIPQDVKIW